MRRLLTLLGGVIALSSSVALTSADPGTSGAAPETLGAPATVVPASQQLSRNPQLPQHPLGAYTDAQYEAQVAALRNQIAKQYADVLQQLGYVDPTTGQFIQGSVETEANRQKGLLGRSASLAREDVTHQHQVNGTLFSGLRGTDQARAEFPYANQIADLETQTPLTLQQLYEKAAGLTSDFTIGDNQLLADAASRRAAALAAQPAGTDPTPPPPADPTMASIVPVYQGDGQSAVSGTEPFVNTVLGAPAPVPDVPYDPATGAGLHLFGSTPDMPALPGSTNPTPSSDTSTVAAPPPLPAVAPVGPQPVNTPGILSATQKKLLGNQFLG